jgi:hypothetical protein
MQVVALDVIAIKVVEEATEPANHDFVVVPAVDELPEEMFSVVVV